MCAWWVFAVFASRLGARLCVVQVEWFGCGFTTASCYICSRDASPGASYDLITVTRAVAHGPCTTREGFRPSLGLPVANRYASAHASYGKFPVACSAEPI